MTYPTHLHALLVKRSLETRFHIDFEWWNRQRRALHVYLQSHLCDEHGSEFAADENKDEVVDWVDPETGEVHKLDLVLYTLRTHCSQQDGYLTRRTSLVEAVFRVFLSNCNQPLKPGELAQQIGREGQADTILRTLSGRQVYKGLRPVTE